ncbi:hypothetical protein BofuT4_uP007140.1 [Botrytis cinerea T4]|uniref:Uncharacterized protein n=1 Tax=Botryotinia fuckeliana (strain T4) TaxID=999810 RepID=G2Y4G5_BOTF4|nr:hypothetical protein BofuT4_uP007140.1 [Botrytis cinerea T4]
MYILHQFPTLKLYFSLFPFSSMHTRTSLQYILASTFKTPLCSSLYLSFHPSILLSQKRTFSDCPG